MRHLDLIPLTDCAPAQQAAVLDIRNQPGVRSAMYTDHVIGPAEHRAYIDTLHGDNQREVYAVTEADAVIGSLSLTRIDLRHRKADWAFFLAQGARGVGSALEWWTITHAFDDLKLDKLNCEVIETNTAVIRLHEGFGFRREGLLRDNLLKDGKRTNVVLLGLTREDWTACRESIAERFRPKLAGVVVTLRTRQR